MGRKSNKKRSYGITKKIIIIIVKTFKTCRTTFSKKIKKIGSIIKKNAVYLELAYFQY